jgi:hypothetical protein
MRENTLIRVAIHEFVFGWGLTLEVFFCDFFSLEVKFKNSSSSSSSSSFFIFIFFQMN